MGPTENPVQKVRTFADDVRKAQGGAASVSTGAGELNTPESASERPSMTALESEVFDVGQAVTGVAPASIVREGRGDHWSLGDALKNSLNSWWGDTVETYKTKRATPQVAPAVDRASIIKVASIENAIAPQDDHTALVTKLRSYTANPNEDFSLKVSPVPIEEPKWSHVEQAVSPQPDVPQPQTVPRTLAPKPIAKTVLPLPTVPRVPARSEFAPQQIEDTHEEPIAIPVRNNIPPPIEPPPLTSPSQTVRITRTVEEIIPELPQEKSFTERARERAMQIREDQPRAGASSYLPSKLVLYIGAAVLVLFTLAGIGSMGYIALTRNNSGVNVFVPQKNNSLVSRVTVRDPIPLGQNRNAFLIDLTRRVREVGGELDELKEFYFVFPNDKTEQELPAEALLTALETNAPGSLVRTITRMAFGVRIAGSNSPFLVFKIKDSEQAFGGMLAWEQYMNEDFAPLFGEDQVLIGASLRPFTDTTISGTDARILRDQNGATLLVYALVNDLVIVSTSEETVRTLLP